MTSYKAAKEAFVSDATGSSVAHVNALSLVALASIFLHSAVETRLGGRGDPSRGGAPPGGAQIPLLLSEFAILLLPLLLSQTLFAARPILLSILLAVPAALLVVFKPSLLDGQKALLPSPTTQVAHTPSPSRPSSPSPSLSRSHSFDAYKSLDSGTTSNAPGQSTTTARSGKLQLQPVPYLTTYRAHMLLMTAVAILAVDFPVFPRYLAKCESFGVSLMDIGVGSFVFSQGLSSAGPMLRDPNYLSAAALPKILKATRKVLPILALGLARVLLVKGTEYPEHVTEYGVHWNFFITMGLLPPMSVLLHPLIRRMSIALVALMIMSVQETLLRATSLQRWVLDGSRDGLIAQNKEGIVSLLGYLAIHTVGLLMGTLLLPPSPSTFRRMQKQKRKSSVSVSPSDQSNNRDHHDDSSESLNGSAGDSKPDKAAIELFSYAAAWWSLLGGLALVLPLYVSTSESESGTSAQRAQSTSTISRRLANMPYVLWIAAYNTSFLLGYLILDTQFFHIPQPDKFPYNTRRSSIGRDQSPTRSDRGTLLSPTEAAAAAYSQSQTQPYSRGAFPPTTTTDPSSTSTSSSPQRSNLKRSSSKRVTHSDHREDSGSGSCGNKILHDTGTGTPRSSPRPRRAPELLEAINTNGLAVFLLANVLTGLVNLTVKTMFASDPQAMCILVGYSAVVCAAAWVSRDRRLW